MNCKFLRKKNFAGRARILQLFAFLGGLTMLMASNMETHAQFANVPVTGFNADIVADGLGSLGSVSTTADVDGTGYVFVNATFGPVATVCAVSTNVWPTSNQITSTNTTTGTGIVYQLQSPGNGATTNNNALRLGIGVSGTLNLTTPTAASNLYFVCLGGGGATTFTATITYSDASSEIITPVVAAPDWCGVTATYRLTTQQYYRVSRTAATCTGSNCQYIYEIPAAIGAANYGKTIASITFNNVSGGYLSVLAVGMKTPCTVPTTAPSALAFTDSTSSSVTGSFTLGTATNYLVVRYPMGSTPTTPVNGTTYSVGGALGTGTVASIGTTNTFTATGLNPSTAYDFYVYGYNTGTTCGGPVFNTASISGTQWTKSCATLTSGTIATTAASVCPSISFTLSLTGATTGPAITYQWQSAPTGTGSFVNVATSGTSSTYVGTQSAATDYRCILTCSGANIATTPNVTLTMNPPTSCYCAPTSTTQTNYFISSFSTTAGTTNITNNGTGSGQYNDYFATMSASAVQGNVVNFSWTGNVATSQKRAIYIDWNQDGDFVDAGEQVYNGTAITTTTNTGSFTVPYTALTGTTRMRIRSTQNSNTMAPCGLLSNGEAEDYAFTVILATGCVNPVNLNITGTTTTTATVAFSVPPVGNAPTNYIYELRTDGTAAGSGATGLAQSGTVTTSPITLTGLGQGTNYVLFARTFCSAGDTSAWTSIALATTYDILTPVPLTGFNADVIANGVGASATSTNNNVDGAGYGLVANDYRTTSASTAPTNSLPISRSIVNGLKKYTLAPYYSNNSLRMSAVTTGTIRFLSPKKANRVFVMGVSGSGISTNATTIYFRDGTTQTATQGYPDWYTSGNNVASAVGRINYSNNVLEAGPYLHDSAIVITTVNRDKQIDSIGFSHTGAVMNVLAVSIIPNTNQSCTLPLAIDSVFNITSGTASVAWRGNGTNADYQLSVVAQGGYADAGTITTGTGSGANTSSLSGFNSATNYQAYVRTNCGSGSYSDWIGPIDFTTLSSNCNGTPAAGTLTTSTTNVCLNTAYNLSVANVSTNIGITLKWQSSPTGLNTWTTLSTVTPVLGTTTYNYNVVSQAAGTDYRCIIACSYSNDSSVSNLVTVAQNSFNNCYCASTASSSTYAITHFETTGATVNVSITSSGGITSTGYSNYTLTDTVKAVMNTTVNLAGTTSDNGVKVWVDWNHDGDFDDAGENVFSTGSYVAAFSGSFTVPVTALAGYTRMRVKADYYSTAPTTCGNITNGETEDYAFYAIPQAVCTGVPVPGNTIASVTSLCQSGTSNLSLTNNYMTNSGITYQWQSSTDGTLWNNISATTISATTPTITQTTSFRCRLICAAGPDTGYSNPVVVTVNALPVMAITPSQAAFCTGGSATLVATGASTYTWTPSATLNVSTGNTVIASPTVITTYTVTGIDANNCSNTAVTTVGPINAFTPVAASTNTCAANLPVSISVTPIATAVGSMEYRLTDTLGAVIADWQAGTNFTVTPVVQGPYKYYVFARNTTCTSSLSDTGTVLFYAGFGATVISNNASCANGDGSLVVGNVQGPGSGTAPYTWYSNDFSTSSFNPIYAELKGVATVTSGYLQLTPNTTSQNGGLLIKNPTSINGHLDSVKFALSVPTSGADGLSWSFGNNLVYYSTGDSSNLEAGVGNKLIISFDSYGTSGNGTNGIYLTYGQTNSYFGLLTTVTSTMLAYSSNLTWRAATNKQIIVSISSSDKLTLTVGGTVVFNAVQLPAAYTNANKSSWQHMIAARTGGVAEQHYIDNLGIYYTGDSYVYGSAPAGSGTMPSSWQTSPIFSGLNGGDSLDLWVANPSSATTCNKKLGTFGVSAPVVTSLLSFDNPTCVGVEDGYVQLKVPVAGTYSVSYNKNGGNTITQTGLVSGNDGINENIVFLLNQGSYTNFKVMNATPCVSNTIAGPIVLTAPTATTVAASSDVSAPITQPGAGTQYYTNSTCDLIAAVTSPNNLGQVTASVSVSSTVSTSTSGEPYLGRSYVITPSQNGSLGATLKLFFTAADFTNYNAAASVGTGTYPVILSDGSNLRIRAFHGLPASGTTGPGGSYDASNSDILQPTSITWNAIGNFWVVDVYSPNGFSGFFANTTTGVPLNITLGKISAHNEGAVNVVAWDTKSEAPNDKFIIERSNDGRTFSGIGTQQGKGSAPSEYTFVDNKPFSGINYYRLIMMNVDGTKEYSTIVTAEVKNGDRFRFNVFPNPATSEVTVTVSDVIGKGWVELTDITGRTIVSKEVTANTSLSLSLTGLAEGMYMVKFHDDVRVQTIKVNKSK